MLSEGVISATDLHDIFIRRINRFNPQLNCFRVVLEASAFHEAQDAQRRLNDGERSPLLGVPVAIKDDIDVKGELTTFASAAVTTPKPADAEVVGRLRDVVFDRDG